MSAMVVSSCQTTPLELSLVLVEPSTHRRHTFVLQAQEHRHNGRSRVIQCTAQTLNKHLVHLACSRPLTPTPAPLLNTFLPCPLEPYDPQCTRSQERHPHILFKRRHSPANTRQRRLCVAQERAGCLDHGERGHSACEGCGRGRIEVFGAAMEVVRYIRVRRGA